MKIPAFVFVFQILALLPFCTSAQQQAVVMSRCGGADTVIIPNIIDNDLDGMDDHLEQMLLDRFMPVIIQFNNENCPGPALDGTGDSNLVACHIYPYPQQYTRSRSLDSVLTHPVPVVPAHGLHAGLIWYEPLIKVNTAVLYGQDCGLSGHKADVEGFNFSIKYIGPDTLAGWMYDTVMQNWMGGTIQTISHAGTLCQQVETHPYKSALFPAGLDTVYASPDKHGNYLTISGCGSSFICNPGCGGTQIVKHVRNINLGEPNATLVTDMGNLYPAYVGNPPWQTANFLSSLGGNAGSIRDKMIMPLTSDFITGQTLTAAQICPIYTECFGASGSAALYYNCEGTSFWFYGQYLTQSGFYQHVLTNSYGCDSTIALTFSIVLPDSTSYMASFCQNGNYNFNGKLLTAAGVYTDTLSNMHGCDSVVTLTLAANLPDSYSYSDSVCSGNIYNFNGRPLILPGLYNDTLLNSFGCDSVVNLILSVDSLPAVTWNGPDTIYISGDTILTGGSPPGGVYSGNGVSGNFYIPGSASGPQIITYTYSDGQGCASTATKYYTLSTNVGITETSISNSLLLYPNPANDQLFLQSEFLSGTEINPLVYDLTGKIITLPSKRQGDKITFNTSALSEGMYWIKLNVNGYFIGKKFVKMF